MPLIAVIVGGTWFASRFVEPAPPNRIAMSTGSEAGAYHLFGKRYAEHLARSGIKLDLKTSNGSAENFARIRDPSSGVHVALMQGGLPDTGEVPELLSLGRVFMQPIWVFYRGNEELSTIAELKGKRISPGPIGSGTQLLAAKLLKGSGIDGSTATIRNMSVRDSVAGLRKGDLDAIFLALAPEAPLVGELLRDPAIKLMSFANAEAFVRLFPYLTRVTLPRGVVDLVKNVPPRDIELVANEAALVVRADLHPALVGLLAEAVKRTHGGGGLFQRVGTYPKLQDPEFQLSEDAERFYRSGPSFLHRFLPFWLATFIQRMVVLVVPVATLALPLVKLIPAMFRWRHRQRLLHWYGQLKQLEARVAFDTERSEQGEQRLELTRISDAVDAIPIPIGFSEQFYSLRAAIDLVKARIA